MQRYSSCTIEGCTNEHYARGWCPKHYKFFSKREPIKMVRHTGTPEQRFWAKVNFDGPIPEARPDLGQCWLWTAAIGTKGYGLFKVEGQPGSAAHRWAYEFAVSLIPAGMEIDHLCFVRPCVRPTHLESVTQTVNKQRLRHWNGTKTMCLRGHPFDEVNTYTRPGDGKRRCRECERMRRLGAFA